MAGLAGSQPSNLVSPDPAQDLAKEAMRGVPDISQPAPQAPAQAPSEAPAAQPEQPPQQAESNPFDSMDSGQQPQQSSGNPFDDIASPAGDIPADQVKDYGMLPYGISGKPLTEQIKDAPARAELSYADGDYEKEQVLSKHFGAGNFRKVTRKDEEFYMVKKEDGKWEKFPAKGIEPIGDVAGMARLGQEAGVYIGAAPEVAAASLASGPAAPATFIGGVALASGLAKSSVDAMKGAIGIKPKESIGEKAGEYVSDIGYSLLGEGAAQGVNRLLADRATQKAAKQGLTQMADESMKSSMQRIKGGSDILKEAGLIENVGNTGTPISAAQVGYESPEVKDKIAALRQDKGFQSFLQLQGDNIKNGLYKLFGMAGDLQSPKNDLAISAKKASNLALQAEGSLVGNFRTQAKDAAGNGTVVMQNSRQVFQNLTDSLGLIRDDEKLKFIGGGPGESMIDGLQRRTGMTPSEASQVADKLNTIADVVYNQEGRIGFGKMMSLYDEFQGVTKFQGSLQGKGDPIIYDMYQAIRDDTVDNIGSLLKGSGRTQQAYEGQLARYSDLKDAEKTLKSSFTEGMSSRAFADSIFSGKYSAGKIAALKRMTQEVSPEAWENVTGSYLKNVIDDSKDEFGKVDFAKVANNKIFKDQEIVQQVWGDKAKYVPMFLDHAEQFQKLSKAAAPYATDEIEEGAKAAAGLYMSLHKIYYGGKAIAGAYYDAMRGKLGDEMMSQQGIDKILKRIPPPQRNEFLAVTAEMAKYSASTVGPVAGRAFIDSRQGK